MLVVLIPITNDGVDVLINSNADMPFPYVEVQSPVSLHETCMDLAHTILGKRLEPKFVLYESVCSNQETYSASVYTVSCEYVPNTDCDWHYVNITALMNDAKPGKVKHWLQEILNGSED